MPLLMPPSGFRDLGGRSWPATSESEGNEFEAEEAMPVPFPVALNVCNWCTLNAEMFATYFVSVK